MVHEGPADIKENFVRDLYREFESCTIADGRLDGVATRLLIVRKNNGARIAKGIANDVDLKTLKEVIEGHGLACDRMAFSNLEDLYDAGAPRVKTKDLVTEGVR